MRGDVFDKGMKYEKSINRYVLFRRKLYGRHISPLWLRVIFLLPSRRAV